ncbi:MAG: hypothetical protein ACOC0Z_04370 [Halohasta sp.]
MTTESDVLVYVIVGGPLLVVLLLLLLMGPLGWFIAVFLGIGVMILRSLVQDGAEEGSDKENCSVCGSLNDPSRERCRHCDAPL